MRRTLGVLAVVGGVTVLAVALMSLAVWLPPQLIDTTGLNAADRLTAENNLRSTLAAIVGGIAIAAGTVVAAIGLAQTSRQNRDQLQLLHRGQVNERFSRAVEQIGSDKLQVRVGGVYSLEQIGRDATDLHDPVIETLAAFLRERRSKPVPQGSRDIATLAKADRAREALTMYLGRKPTIDELRDEIGSPAAEWILPLEADFDSPSIYFPPPPADIQAAASVVGRLNNPRATIRGLLDLTDVDLRWGVDLPEADLRLALMKYARLELSTLIGARLQSAMLAQAHLEGTNLSYANLESTDLEGAYLQLATLVKANLDASNLTSSNLEGADLTSASLIDANLVGAKLRGACLTGANLTRANLGGARLEGVDLSKTSGLTRESLQFASTDALTVLPRSLE